MNSYGILIGIIPLVIFVIVDSFASLRTALVAAVIVALLELGASFYLIGELDSISLFSVFLVGLMAFMSYKKSSPILIKLQPVILNIVLAVYLIGSFYLNTPLLSEIALKYRQTLPAEFAAKLANPVFIHWLRLATLSFGLGLLLHAIPMTYSALKMSKWWWITIRALATPFIILFVIVFNKLFFATYLAGHGLELLQ